MRWNLEVENVQPSKQTGQANRALEDIQRAIALVQTERTEWKTAFNLFSESEIRFYKQEIFFFTRPPQFFPKKKYFFNWPNNSNFFGNF